MNTSATDSSGDESMTGAVVAVTGGRGGIGRAICESLRCSGATVVSLDLRRSDQDEQIDIEEGTGYASLDVDVSTKAACETAIGEILAAHGRLDGLVNAAGINVRAAAADVTVEDWNRVLAVNLSGTHYMCQSAYGALAESRGSVVNIASTNGYRAVQGSAAYCVSKAAVIHLTRVLALEWASDGIRVNAIGPTLVETPMTKTVLARPGYLDAKLSRIPLNRLATPSDVAAATRFLLASSASMVSGQTLFVDGGATIW